LQKKGKGLLGLFHVPSFGDFDDEEDYEGYDYEGYQR
jgi:hypothetical protein